jgi:SAM-dependent methyltransferase
MPMTNDRHALYEAAVQGVDYDLDFAEKLFRHLRGRPLRVLREDFCGTAALSCGWALRHPSNVAYGVDLDPSVLAWARKHRLARLNGADRVHLVEANVLDARVPPVDVTLAYNFSFWIFKTRRQLLAYFRAARRGLKKDGLLLLSMYGGTGVFETMVEPRRIPAKQAVDGSRLPAFK